MSDDGTRGQADGGDGGRGDDGRADEKRRSPRRSDTAEMETVAEARARLDQLQEEAGLARTGAAIARRSGEEPGSPDPPLDWRMTPRNVALQLAAVALFVAVVWFLVALVSDSLKALFA